MKNKSPYSNLFIKIKKSSHVVASRWDWTGLPSQKGYELLSSEFPSPDLFYIKLLHLLTSLCLSLFEPYSWIFVSEETLFTLDCTLFINLEHESLYPSIYESSTKLLRHKPILSICRYFPSLGTLWCLLSSNPTKAKNQTEQCYTEKGDIIQDDCNGINRTEYSLTQLP